MNKILKIHTAHGEDSRTGAAGQDAHTRVIAITSGKGGVGKTNITSNLGIALASRGARVCIFDADTSLANINVIMGLAPRHTIEHLLSGEKTIDDIIINGPRGVKIVPAASGIAHCAQLDDTQRQRLFEALAELEERFDYLLIDTAAGIGETVLSFLQSAQYVIVVISPEPTSLTDAFALIRVLRRRGFDRPLYVLVNMVLNYANSMEVFKRFEAAARKYLHVQVHYLGYIPRDEAVGKAVAHQTPVVLQAPTSVASRCFMTLADVLSKQLKTGEAMPRFSEFWRTQTGTPAESAPSPGPAPESATQSVPQAVSPPAPQPPATPPSSGPAVSPEAETADGKDEPERSLERLLSFLADEKTSDDMAAPLLHRLIEAYENRFHSLPCDTQQIVRLLSESPRLNETEFRDLIFTLESNFEKRFHHPLRSLESRITKLLDDIQDTKDLCRQLVLQLKERHGDELCREVFTTPEEMVRLVRDGALDQETLAFLVEGLGAVYRERYGALPDSESHAIVAGMHKLVERLNRQETALEDSLLRLSRFIDDSLREVGGQKNDSQDDPPAP